MRRVNLLEVLRPTMRMRGEAPAIENGALKQISRGNYAINDDHIEMIIEVNEERLIVYVDNELTLCDFRDRVYIADKKEPSLEYLYKKTSTSEEISLIEALRNYKEENLKHGTDLMNETWFKLYHVEDPKDSYRTLYGAKWIDYEKQLELDNIIKDSFGLNGLWAMPVDMMVQCMNEECFERYGKHLLIVKPVPNELYLLDEKEVIGPRYAVEVKLDLSKPDDVGKLFARLDSLKMERAEKEKEEIRVELRREKQEKMDIVDQLIEVDKIASRFKIQRIIFAVIGFAVGIIIGYLL